jgi:Rps23 Pro-64 3,4-dihydroxylase Tpa1-like proline 4-hydroxylase
VSVDTVVQGVLVPAATAVTLIALLYTALLRGKIYLSRHVAEIRASYEREIAQAAQEIDDVRHDRDERVAEVRADREKRLSEVTEERDFYRQALMLSRETIRIQTEQIGELVDGVRTSHVALESIARAGGALPHTEEVPDGRAPGE